MMLFGRRGQQSPYSPPPLPPTALPVARRQVGSGSGSGSNSNPNSPAAGAHSSHTSTPASQASTASTSPASSSPTLSAGSLSSHHRRQNSNHTNDNGRPPPPHLVDVLITGGPYHTCPLTATAVTKENEKVAAPYMTRYRWFRSMNNWMLQPIAGAFSSTYQPTAADLHCQLHVELAIVFAPPTAASATDANGNGNGKHDDVVVDDEEDEFHPAKGMSNMNNTVHTDQSVDGREIKGHVPATFLTIDPAVAETVEQNVKDKGALFEVCYYKDKLTLLCNDKKVKLRRGQKTKKKEEYNQHMSVILHPTNTHAFTLCLNAREKIDLSCDSHGTRDIIVLTINSLVHSHLKKKGGSSNHSSNQSNGSNHSNNNPPSSSQSPQLQVASSPNTDNSNLNNNNNPNLNHLPNGLSPQPVPLAVIRQKDAHYNHHVMLQQAPSPSSVDLPRIVSIKIEGGPFHTCPINMTIDYAGGREGAHLINWFRAKKHSWYYTLIPSATNCREYTPSIEDIDNKLRVECTPVRADNVRGTTVVTNIPSEFLRMDPSYSAIVEASLKLGKAEFYLSIHGKPLQKRTLQLTEKGARLLDPDGKLKMRCKYNNLVTVIDEIDKTRVRIKIDDPKNNKHKKNDDHANDDDDDNHSHNDNNSLNSLNNNVAGEQKKDKKGKPRNSKHVDKSRSSTTSNSTCDLDAKDRDERDMVILTIHTFKIISSFTAKQRKTFAGLFTSGANNASDDRYDEDAMKLAREEREKVKFHKIDAAAQREKAATFNLAHLNADNEEWDKDEEWLDEDIDVDGVMGFGASNLEGTGGDHLPVEGEEDQLRGPGGDHLNHHDEEGDADSKDGHASGANGVKKKKKKGPSGRKIRSESHTILPSDSNDDNNDNANNDNPSSSSSRRKVDISKFEELGNGTNASSSSSPNASSASEAKKKPQVLAQGVIKIEKMKKPAPVASLAPPVSASNRKWSARTQEASAPATPAIEIPPWDGEGPPPPPPPPPPAPPVSSGGSFRGRNPNAAAAGGAAGGDSSATGGGGATTTVAEEILNIAENKTKGMHWSKIPKADMAKSVWQGINDQMIDIDEDKMLDLFKKQELYERETAEKPEGANHAVLFELKKRHLVGIFLQSSGKEIEEIYEALVACDDSFLEVTGWFQLKQYMPEDTERIELMKTPKNLVDQLGKPEQLYYLLESVPQYGERIECLLFKCMLVPTAQEVTGKMGVVTSACGEIRLSEKFRRILEIILAFGNFLNFGTTRTKAIGFRMDALAALPEIKAADKKTSLLQYLVHFLEEREPDILTFRQTFPHLTAASKVDIKSVRDDIQRIEASITRLDALLSSSSSTSNTNDKYLQTMTVLAKEAKATLAILQQSVAVMNEEIKNLGVYLAEPVAFDCEAIFQILLKFGVDFDKAKKDNDAELAKIAAANNPTNKTAHLKGKKKAGSATQGNNLDFAMGVAGKFSKRGDNNDDDDDDDDDDEDDDEDEDNIYGDEDDFCEEEN